MPGHSDQLREIVAGAERNDTELGGRTLAQHPVRDLVHGAVTADGDDAANAVFRRPRRELAGVPRSLGPSELDRPPLRAERADDGVFEAAARAAPCRGVEDDVRVNQ